MSAIEDILKLGSTTRVWVYGAGGFGQACADALVKLGVAISGFIDRRSENYSMGLNGLTVSSPENFRDIESVVFIGVLNPGASHQELENWCRGRFKCVFFPQEFVHFIPEVARYWLQPVPSATVYANHPSSIRALFSDERSKLIFDLVLKARTGLSFELDSYVNYADQYVPEFVSFDSSITFVDVGAFDGDSFLSLLGAKHRVSRWIAFEPDLRSFEKLVQTSRAYKDVEITLIPCGLSHVVGEFSFIWDGPSSKVGKGGVDTSVCRVLPFDDIFPNAAVDFVKMDIEGGEINALKGMLKMLARCRPSIAISAYHKWDDIPELMNFVRSVVPNGSFYLRQHGYSCFDTVLYYIPAK